MTVRKMLALFASAALVAASSPAQDSLAEHVAEVVQGLQQAHGLPGVVVGVVDHGRASSYVFGTTRRNGGRAVDMRTEFEIGSVTKVFTATLLALDVQKGIVGLSDPLQKWVPPGVRVPTFDGRPMTLEDLATHTSGLPDDPPLQGIEHLNDQDLWAFLDGFRLTQAPGTHWAYSNTGFALLGHALQRAAGEMWPALVVREICVPLGLSDTAVRLSTEQRARFAQGYRPNGQPAPVAMKTWPAFLSAGGLRSTGTDMMAFLRFNLGLADTPLNSLLPILQQVRRPAIGASQMALGWQTLESMPERRISSRVFFKNGGTLGFHAFIAYVPETRCGIVVLTNEAYRLDAEALDLLGFLHRADAAAPAQQ